MKKVLLKILIYILHGITLGIPFIVNKLNKWLEKEQEKLEQEAN